MPHNYVFVDGKYVRVEHARAMERFFGQPGELNLHPIMKQADASRVYFYDAIDYEPCKGETPEQTSARIERLEALFSSINSLRGFHVRPGSVRRGKKKSRKR